MSKIIVSVRCKLHAEPLHGTHESTTHEPTTATYRQHAAPAAAPLVTQLHRVLPGDHLP